MVVERCEERQATPTYVRFRCVCVRLRLRLVSTYREVGRFTASTRMRIRMAEGWVNEDEDEDGDGGVGIDL